MEQRLNQIQGNLNTHLINKEILYLNLNFLLTVQIDVIMEAQEEQNMLLRNFIDSQQDMRCRFPIKTSKKLKEINDEITPENRKSYVRILLHLYYIYII